MPDPEHVSTTRAAYDDTADVYAQWVGTEISSAIEGPIDRALLGAFVELMAHADGRPVADVGCGPGRVAALLAALRCAAGQNFHLSPSLSAKAGEAAAFLASLRYAAGRFTIPLCLGVGCGR